MLDVQPQFFPPERLEAEPPRHPLLELPQLRPREQRLQIRLADQDDLEHRAALVIDIREQADLLQDVGLEVLRLVDDDDGVRLEGDQRREKILERVDQVVAARRRHPGAVLRDDAEVLEHLLQKVVAFEQRVVDDRHECLPLEPLEHGPAQQRLAGADLAGDDDQRLAPLERVGHLRERGRCEALSNRNRGWEPD